MANEDGRWVPPDEDPDLEFESRSADGTETRYRARKGRRRRTVLVRNGRVYELEDMGGTWMSFRVGGEARLRLIGPPGVVSEDDGDD